MGRTLFISVLLLSVVSCSAYHHGATLHRYQGQLLRADQGPGAERLAMERDFDASLDTYVREHGVPDYLYVADHKEIFLFYLERDRWVRAARSSWDINSTIEIADGINDEVIPYLHEEDQQRLRAARRERAERAVSAPQVTIADAIRSCRAIARAFDPPVACDVHYPEGTATLVFRFDSDDALAEQWPEVEAGVAEPFCDAANAGNRLAQVLAVVDDEARAYVCEAGVWSEWFEFEEFEDAASPRI